MSELIRLILIGSITVILGGIVIALLGDRDPSTAMMLILLIVAGAGATIAITDTGDTQR